MTTADRMSGTLLLTPLTPIHIGSGEVLTDMDYTIRKNQFIVKDVRAFFEAHRDDVGFALDAVEHGLDIGEEFSRYRLPYHGDPLDPKTLSREPRCGAGAPREHKDHATGGFNNPFAVLSQAAPTAAATITKPQKNVPALTPRDPGLKVGEVREFIKDPFGKPFLPGSSIKGSIRTALAWALAKDQPLNDWIKDELGDTRLRKEFAFRNINKRLFGDKVIEDLLKALIVADSAPLDLHSGFGMSQIKVMNMTRTGFEPKSIPLHAETLLPIAGAIPVPFFIDLFRLKNDTILAKAANGKGIPLLTNPDGFTNALADFSRTLLAHERKFYLRQKQGSTVSFIDGLRDPVMATGFGTGWLAKTLGCLMSDPDVQKLRDRFGYRDGRPNKNMGSHGVSEFPKTRKWAKGPGGFHPMGWFKMELLWK